MTQRILEILDNVKYWDGCPEDYIKDIDEFLEANKKALLLGNVSNSVNCKYEAAHPFMRNELGSAICPYCNKIIIDC